MDQFISPETGDYTGHRCASLENPVYLRLATPVGSYWADPSLGSRLHELTREKDISRVYLLARQYAEQALQPLVNDGRASHVSVESRRFRPGWLVLLVNVTDNTGTPRTFKHPVRIA